jgi:hypothetical protein
MKRRPCSRAAQYRFQAPRSFTGKIGRGHELHKGVPDNAGSVDDPIDAAEVRNHPAQDRSHAFRIIDITAVISRFYPLKGQFLEGLGNFPTGSQPHGGIGLSGRGSGPVPARLARDRACKTGVGGNQAVVVHLGVKFAAAQEDQARLERRQGIGQMRGDALAAARDDDHIARVEGKIRRVGQGQGLHVPLNGEGLLAVEPDLCQAVVQAQGLFDPGFQVGIAIQRHATEQYRVIFQGGVQEHAPQALGHNCRRVGVVGAPGDQQTKFPVRGGHQLLHGGEKPREPGRYGLDILDGGVGSFVQNQHQAGH